MTTAWNIFSLILNCTFEECKSISSKNIFHSSPNSFELNKMQSSGQDEIDDAKQQENQENTQLNKKLNVIVKKQSTLV